MDEEQRAMAEELLFAEKKKPRLRQDAILWIIGPVTCFSLPKGEH